MKIPSSTHWGLVMQEEGTFLPVVEFGPYEQEPDVHVVFVGREPSVRQVRRIRAKMAASGFFVMVKRFKREVQAVVREYVSREQAEAKLFEIINKVFARSFEPTPALAFATASGVSFQSDTPGQRQARNRRSRSTRPRFHNATPTARRRGR